MPFLVNYWALSYHPKHGHFRILYASLFSKMLMLVSLTETKVTSALTGESRDGQLIGPEGQLFARENKDPKEISKETIQFWKSK